VAERDELPSCSPLPPPMSCCFPSTSLLGARSSADVTSGSGHMTQTDEVGASPPRPVARPTTLSVAYFVFYR